MTRIINFVVQSILVFSCTNSNIAFAQDDISQQVGSSNSIEMEASAILDPQNPQLQPDDDNQSNFEGIAVLISALAFGLGLFNLFLAWKFRQDDKNSSIIDGFWLREVIIPQVVTPLNETLMENKFRFTVRLSDPEITELVETMDGLKIKLGLMSIVSKDLVRIIEESIDSLILSVVHRSNPQMAYAPMGVSNAILSKDPYLECYQLLIREMVSAHKSANWVM